MQLIQNGDHKPVVLSDNKCRLKIDVPTAHLTENRSVAIVHFYALNLLVALMPVQRVIRSPGLTRVVKSLTNISIASKWKKVAKILIYVFSEQTIAFCKKTKYIFF